MSGVASESVAQYSEQGEYCMDLTQLLAKFSLMEWGTLHYILLVFLVGLIIFYIWYRRKQMGDQ